VGFSYAKVSKPIYNDAIVSKVDFSLHHFTITQVFKTAYENYNGLKSFLSIFPYYRQNRFFIVGESYAGVYVSTLAQKILKGSQEFVINLKVDHLCFTSS